MTPSIEQAAGYAVGGVTLAGLGTIFIRFLMKSVRAEKMEAISAGADLNSYTRLQKEIKRLEGIISAQKLRIDEMDTKWDAIRNIELDGVVDLAMLSALIAQMPCGKCESNGELFRKAQAVLQRIIDRRIERQTILKIEKAAEKQEEPQLGEEILTTS